MISFFNRQCIYTGYSKKRRDEITDILKKNRILYILKEENALRFPSAQGEFGQLRQYQSIYKIYIHQKDFDEVSYLLRK